MNDGTGSDECFLLADIYVVFLSIMSGVVLDDSWKHRIAILFLQTAHVSSNNTEEGSIQLFLMEYKSHANLIIVHFVLKGL